MAGKSLRQRTWLLFLSRLNLFEERYKRVRVVTGFVHILHAEVICFGLKSTRELHKGKRKRKAHSLPCRIPDTASHKDQRNRSDLGQIAASLLSHRVARRHVGYLVRHNTRQFRLVISSKDQSRIHVEITAWKSERIDLIGVDYLDREWHARIRVANQVLSDAIHIF